jgi:hypothetical protein
MNTILLSAMSQTIPWVRRAIVATLGVFLCCAFGLEFFDRFGDSSSRFAWSQLAREITNERAPVEMEALSLLREVRTRMDLPALALVRVGLAEDLGSIGAAARFNPTTFRLAISPSLGTRPASTRRAILLHEIGHAVAFSWGASPKLDLGDAQASEVIAHSLLSNQIFHESFADAFAVIWSLRANIADSTAWGALAYAVASPQSHSSPAHETYFALRLLKLRLAEARQAPVNDLPRILSHIASQGTAETIASLGAEREAACYMGARALTRYALDWGYESFSLPWEMAKTHPISPTDPMARSLATLAAQRSMGFNPSSPWNDALAGGRVAIEQSLIHAKTGASPEQVARMAVSGFSMSRQAPLAKDVNAVAYATRLAAGSRSGWRAVLAQIALIADEYLLPSPTYGCHDFAAFKSLTP